MATSLKILGLSPSQYIPKQFQQLAAITNDYSNKCYKIWKKYEKPAMLNGSGWIMTPKPKYEMWWLFFPCRCSNKRRPSLIKIISHLSCLWWNLWGRRKLWFQYGIPWARILNSCVSLPGCTVAQFWKLIILLYQLWWF